MCLNDDIFPICGGRWDKFSDLMSKYVSAESRPISGGICEISSQSKIRPTSKERWPISEESSVRVGHSSRNTCKVDSRLISERLVGESTRHQKPSSDVS